MKIGAFVFCVLGYFVSCMGESTIASATTAAGPTAPGKVAYGIMVYQRKDKSPDIVLSQFKRLFNAIYYTKFTFVVHVDSKSEAVLIEKITQYLDQYPNAHMIPSVSVSWAGVTVVERTLALMQKALEVDEEWKYFVNIGQEDYPLEGPETIQAHLARVPEATNFIYCWDIAGHNFFGQWEMHQRRVTRVYVDYFDGQTHEMEQVHRPVPPSSEYRFYKSLQQTTLARPFVDYAVRSSESRRLLLFLANSKAPDEIFFPTLVQMDQRFASKASCNNTLHLSHWIRPGGSWHPEYLTPLHLPMILDKREKKEALWARKFDVEKGSRALLDVLDYMRMCDIDPMDKMDWAPAIVFAEEMKGDIVLRRPAPTPTTTMEADIEGSTFAALTLAEEAEKDGSDQVCRVTKDLIMDGKAVSGDELLRHLDKARRVHDAETIMKFVTKMEAYSKAQGSAYHQYQQYKVYLEQQQAMKHQLHQAYHQKPEYAAHPHQFHPGGVATESHPVITTSVTADRSIHPEDAAAEERGAGQVSQEEGKGVPPSELPADSTTSTAAATTSTKGVFAAAPLWEFAGGGAGVDSGVGAATGLL